MDTFKNIIREICEEEDIDYSILSKGWVIMLRKNGITKFITGNKFDLNTHASGIIFDDKYATYDVLKELDVSVIEHKIMFRTDDYIVCKNYFISHNKNIVIKTNTGTCGNGVYHITNEEEIEPLLKSLFVKNYSISLCPFYDIKHEYRLVMLNNQCVLLYGKNRPIVYGDGVSSIRELLIRFNPNYFKDILNDDKYNRILFNGEKYEYGWQFNLSKGSVPFEVTNKDLKTRLLEFSGDLTSKLNLDFCSLDIIDTTVGLFVMEINSGIMTKNYVDIVPNGKSIIKEIYRKAIKSMLEIK